MNAHISCLALDPNTPRARALSAELICGESPSDPWVRWLGAPGPSGSNLARAMAANGLLRHLSDGSTVARVHARLEGPEPGPSDGPCDVVLAVALLAATLRAELPQHALGLVRALEPESVAVTPVVLTGCARLVQQGAGWTFAGVEMPELDAGLETLRLWLGAHAPQKVIFFTAPGSDPTARPGWVALNRLLGQRLTHATVRDLPAVVDAVAGVAWRCWQQLQVGLQREALDDLAEALAIAAEVVDDRAREYEVALREVERQGHRRAHLWYERRSLPPQIATAPWGWLVLDGGRLQTVDPAGTMERVVGVDLGDGESIHELTSAGGPPAWACRGGPFGRALHIVEHRGGELRLDPRPLAFPDGVVTIEHGGLLLVGQGASTVAWDICAGEDRPSMLVDPDRELGEDPGRIDTLIGVLGDASGGRLLGWKGERLWTALFSARVGPSGIDWLALDDPPGPILGGALLQGPRGVLVALLHGPCGFAEQVSVWSLDPARCRGHLPPQLLERGRLPLPAAECAFMRWALTWDGAHPSDARLHLIERPTRDGAPLRIGTWRANRPDEAVRWWHTAEPWQSPVTAPCPSGSGHHLAFRCGEEGELRIVDTGARTSRAAGRISVARGRRSLRDAIWPAGVWALARAKESGSERGVGGVSLPFQTRGDMVRAWMAGSPLLQTLAMEFTCPAGTGAFARVLGGALDRRDATLLGRLTAEVLLLDAGSGSSPLTPGADLAAVARACRAAPMPTVATAEGFRIEGSIEAWRRLDPRLSPDEAAGMAAHRESWVGDAPFDWLDHPSVAQGIARRMERAAEALRDLGVLVE